MEKRANVRLNSFIVKGIKKIIAVEKDSPHVVQNTSPVFYKLAVELSF